MKKYVYLVMTLVTVLFTGCGFLLEDPAPTEQDLVGRWSEVANPLHYRVFLHQADGQGTGYWGYEWNEDEDVFESDLVPYGNGWFTWSLSERTLSFINATDLGTGVVPKRYTVGLSGTTLTLTNQYGNKEVYTKVK